MAKSKHKEQKEGKTENKLPKISLHEQEELFLSILKQDLEKFKEMVSGDQSLVKKPIFKLPFFEGDLTLLDILAFSGFTEAFKYVYDNFYKQDEPLELKTLSFIKYFYDNKSEENDFYEFDIEGFRVEEETIPVKVEYTINKKAGLEVDVHYQAPIELEIERGRIYKTSFFHKGKPIEIAKELSGMNILLDSIRINKNEVYTFGTPAGLQNLKRCLKRKFNEGPLFIDEEGESIIEIRIPGSNSRLSLSPDDIKNLEFQEHDRARKVDYVSISSADPLLTGKLGKNFSADGKTWSISDCSKALNLKHEEIVRFCDINKISSKEVGKELFESILTKFLVLDNSKTDNISLYSHLMLFGVDADTFIHGSNKFAGGTLCEIGNLLRIALTDKNPFLLEIAVKLGADLNHTTGVYQVDGMTALGECIYSGFPKGAQIIIDNVPESVAVKLFKDAMVNSIETEMSEEYTPSWIEYIKSFPTMKELSPVLNILKQAIQSFSSKELSNCKDAVHKIFAQITEKTVLGKDNEYLHEINQIFELFQNPDVKITEVQPNGSEHNSIEGGELGLGDNNPEQHGSDQVVEALGGVTDTN